MREKKLNKFNFGYRSANYISNKYCTTTLRISILGWPYLVIVSGLLRVARPGLPLLVVVLVVVVVRVGLDVGAVLAGVEEL